MTTMSSTTSQHVPTAAPGSLWRRPWLWALIILVLGLGLPLLWALLTAPPPGADDAGAGLPWQVELSGDGRSHVFGLSLPGSTAGEVLDRYGDRAQLAVISRQGEPDALEMLIDPFQAGFIAGKLVLTVQADPQWLRAAAAAAAREERRDAQTVRRALAAPDVDRARGLPIDALAFIPSARLDEDAVTGRFGEPSERLERAGVIYLLYAVRGIAVAVPAAGDGSTARARSVIQYVAPADFEQRLAAPVRAAD